MTWKPGDRLYMGQGTDDSGHYWWAAGERPIEPVMLGLRRSGGRIGDCPFTHEVDGGAQPKRGADGLVRLHHKEGWTAIGWHDHSGPDRRPGCTSTFVARGEHDFAAMVAMFKESFPWAHARMRFELVLELADTVERSTRKPCVCADSINFGEPAPDCSYCGGTGFVRGPAT